MASPGEATCWLQLNCSLLHLHACCSAPAAVHLRAALPEAAWCCAGVYHVRDADDFIRLLKESADEGKVGAMPVHCTAAQCAWACPCRQATTTGCHMGCSPSQHLWAGTQGIKGCLTKCTGPCMVSTLPDSRLASTSYA